VCGQTQTGNNVCPGTVFGATIPAPIWREYMNLALAGQLPLDYPQPDPNDMGTIYAVRDPSGSFVGCAPGSTSSSCYGSGGPPPSRAPAPTTPAPTSPTTEPSATTVPPGTGKGGHKPHH